MTGLMLLVDFLEVGQHLDFPALESLPDLQAQARDIGRIGFGLSLVERGIEPGIESCCVQRGQNGVELDIRVELVVRGQSWAGGDGKDKQEMGNRSVQNGVPK